MTWKASPRSCSTRPCRPCSASRRWTTSYATCPTSPAATVFAVEYLPGQFDQRADSASECIQLISQGERPTVRSAKVYALEGDLTDADVDAIKHYVINPVEAREASWSQGTR